MGQMSAVVELDECRDEVSGGRNLSRARVGNSNGGGGGGMDDVLRRLGAVEVTVLEIQKQVSGISTTLPTLSTKDDLHVVKDDVKDLRTEVGAIVAVIPHLATKADLKDVKTEVGTIAAVIPHLATKADLKDVKTEVGTIAAVIPHLATKADLKDVKTEVGAIAAVIPHLATKADLAELSEKLIKWLIATGIATTGLIATAMKFVH
jgi:hypothetical protein